MARVTTVRHRSRLRAGLAELVAFHHDPRNLVRVSPPFPRVELREGTGACYAGQRQVIVIAAGPLRLRWVERIVRAEGDVLEDVQESGPFRSWHHWHRFEAVEGGSRLSDTVRFRMFPGRWGWLGDRLFVKPVIGLMLRMRHRRTRALLEGCGREEQGGRA